MEIKYRIGTIDDIDNLQKLGLESYSQFKNVLTNENWNIMNSFLSNRNSYENLISISKCFICERENRIIGMAFLVPNGNPTNIFQKEWSYIRMVGVNPDYGGFGIGKNLTQQCIDFAKVNNEKIIALHTSEFMDKARHIYENIGFKKIKEIEPNFGKKYWLYSIDLQ